MTGEVMLVKIFESAIILFIDRPEAGKMRKQNLGFIFIVSII
jgi:hypothetical protein